MALFGKDPAPAAKQTPQRSETSSAGGRMSLIGPNIVIDGTVTGNENLLVEGSVRGKINLESDLRVGVSARVEATVHAKNVTIEGVVIGDVSADSKLELVASAKVNGNLKAPKIVVAEGARFRGSVDMGGEGKRQQGTTDSTAKENANAGNDREQKTH